MFYILHFFQSSLPITEVYNAMIMVFAWELASIFSNKFLVTFAPSAKEKAYLNTLVHHLGLLVLVTQRTASPGFAQHIVYLSVSQALTLVFKPGLCKLVHPDQVNRLILHTPDSLYQCIASKPAVHQNVINMEPAVNGRKEHSPMKEPSPVGLVRKELTVFSGLTTMETSVARIILKPYPRRLKKLNPNPKKIGNRKLKKSV